MCDPVLGIHLTKQALYQRPWVKIPDLNSQCPPFGVLSAAGKDAL